MNLIEKLGLEKCKAIVDGAPEGATQYNQSEYYFKNIAGDKCEMWNPYEQAWFLTYVSTFDILRSIEDLGTAITNHGTTTNDGADNFSHFDHCSDIKNHISPSTVVIER